MKLQRTTLILLVTAVFLGSFVYFREIQSANKREVATTTKQPIFFFKEDQIQSMTIYMDEETVEFERGNGQATGWRLKTSQNSPASNAAVAFLLNLLVEGKSDRVFPIKANQLKEYGLEKPQAVVKVQLKNRDTHMLILGKPDFNRSFLYAQADPSYTTSQPLKVLLVPIDFEYAVNRPMSEWQSQLENSGSSKPSPLPEMPSASPTPESSQLSPTPVTPKSSPTPESAKPTPTPVTPKSSPTPESAKPAPTPVIPKSSSTPERTKPAPTPVIPKPLPTPKSSQPSPVDENSKPNAAKLRGY